jgi:hypothetical protein
MPQRYIFDLKPPSQFEWRKQDSQASHNNAIIGSVIILMSSWSKIKHREFR